MYQSRAQLMIEHRLEEREDDSVEDVATELSRLSPAEARA